MVYIYHVLLLPYLYINLKSIVSIVGYVALISSFPGTFININNEEKGTLTVVYLIILPY